MDPKFHRTRKGLIQISLAHEVCLDDKKRNENCSCLKSQTLLEVFQARNCRNSFMCCQRATFPISQRPCPLIYVLLFLEKMEARKMKRIVLLVWEQSAI